MPRENEQFVNEDLSKPENRINVALFGLMPQDWFREWFLKELNLPTDAVVYPPTNNQGARPDLKVEAYDGSTLAWIEVELGTNEGQVEDYNRRYPNQQVKAIWGRQGSGGDLSLEEIAGFLASQKDLSKQTQVNVDHLRKLIREGLEGASRSTGRACVSDEMRCHPLVVRLTYRLGDKLLSNRGLGAPPVGYLKADTTDTPNNQGFSLGVNSPVSSNGRLSVMSITAGRPKVYFPALSKLEKFLPNHDTAIKDYASLLKDMGLDIGKYEENQRPSLPLDTVLGKLSELASCVQALAESPQRSKGHHD